MAGYNEWAFTHASGAYECCYIAGRCDHEECGAYPGPTEPPSRTDECADAGHPIYGQDCIDGTGALVDRCYCGTVVVQRREDEDE